MANVSVIFYDFDKKVNSTKQPTVGVYNYTITYDCLLKEDCSFISPVLALQPGLNPIYTETGNYRLNYAYIADFGNRYYFVDNWTFSNGLWVASLRLDVLASWKTEIGSTTSYVMRSGSTYDTNIVDNLFPCKAGSHFLGQEIDTEPYTGNTLVLGIIGAGSSGGNMGAVHYYAFTEAQANDFFTYLLGGTTTGGSSFYDLVFNGLTLLEQGLKALFNPMQYIASAKWFPVNFSGTSVNTITFGQWTLAVSCTKLSSQPVKIVTGTFTTPKHPSGATKGAYLYTSPYSRYTLHYEPYGNIPLNASLMKSYSYVYCQNWIDGISGEGKLSIYATNDSQTVIELGTYTAEIGVPVQLAQITNNTLAATISTISSLGSVAVTGDLFELAGIGNAARALMPQLSSIGGNGTIMVYSMPQPSLQLEYLNIVDLNNDHKGRPLCKEKVLNTLSGYIECMDGEIEANATATELETIKTYLENGFFYE